MSDTHRMDMVAGNGDEVMFACAEAGCGRRLVLQRPGGLVVLEQGDFHARHSGSSHGSDLVVDAA